MEVWKPYKGKHKELIETVFCSSDGRIKVIPHNTQSNTKILNGTVTKQGYRSYHISINGKPKNYRGHVLIAETFLDNKDNKPCVDHIDANRLNNCIDNLRWVTWSENNKNPHYIEKLSKRIKHQLSEHNYLQEALKKKCKITNKDGKVLYFDSIQEVGKHFNTKANLSRKVNTGNYFTSSKSKLKGWRIDTVY